MNCQADECNKEAIESRPTCSINCLLKLDEKYVAIDFWDSVNN